MPTGKWKRGESDTQRDAGAQNAWRNEETVEYSNKKYGNKGVPSSATEQERNTRNSTNYSVDSETSRQKRLGKSQTKSGPKSRDFKFFKHETSTNKVK